MTHDLVSTIIPVYNRPDMLRRAVDSVLSQTYRPIEIIIVDDGSTDATASVADRLQDEHSGEIRTLHVANGGPGLARESGRQAARGEFVQYLDSDDRLLPAKFSAQVVALREHPECGIAYGQTRSVDMDGNVLACPLKRTGEVKDSLFPDLLVERWWSTHTPLYRREVCDAAGPWSNMRMCEDWEYEARIAARRPKLIHCPLPLSDTLSHQDGRLTGRPLNAACLMDLHRLIVALHRAAGVAGVDSRCAQRKTFARWAFLVARQCGALGLAAESRACWDVARAAAGSNLRAAKGLRLYGWLALGIGWNAVGRLCDRMDRLRPHPVPPPDSIQDIHHAHA